MEKLVGVEVERMSRLVEDMLLLAQAGEEEFLRPSVIELRPFVQDLVRGLADVAPRRLVVHAIPEMLIEAERTAWRRRCATCCATRSRTPPRTAPSTGRRVRRRPRAVHRRRRRPGHPARPARRRFDRFRRLDGGRARDAGGAGLGLAIVQAIAHAHGGRAWADAAPAGGARFVLEIPVRR